MVLARVAVDELDELDDRDVDDRPEQADSPLRARQRHRVEDALEGGELRNEEREHERQKDQVHEPPVRDRVAGEDAPGRLAGLQSGDDVQERERGQTHRRGDHELEAILSPGNGTEGEAGHDQARGGDSDCEPA